MKKAFNIFILAFYSMGTFCLPLGDFSMLKNMPAMYQHCKATEDKDMTLVDFITDHLLNIDGLFDKHENGDPQKPHHPIQNNHYGQTIFSLTAAFIITVSPLHPDEIKMLIRSDNTLLPDYSSTLLRPPIAA